MRVTKLGLIDANMNEVVRNWLKILKHWQSFGRYSQVMAELKWLRQAYPNLGQEKVFAKPVPFCQAHDCQYPRQISYPCLANQLQGPAQMLYARSRHQKT